jgi:hypothetical protein
VCVDQDDAGSSFDDRHAREREASHLVHTVGDGKQSVWHVELRLSPQAGIDGRRGLCVEKLVSLGIGGIRYRRNEASHGVLKVLAILEWELRSNRLVRRRDRGLGRPAFW